MVVDKDLSVFQVQKPSHRKIPHSGNTTMRSVCFASKGYGGRVTDVEIVRDYGFFENIKKGDVVMADRGFLIEEDLVKIGASLAIPATERSTMVANVRIHVERIIGNLRKKFTILRGPLKIRDMCTDSADETFIDKIITVCCCLHNSMPSIVPSV